MRRCDRLHVANHVACMRRAGAKHDRQQHQRKPLARPAKSVEGSKRIWDRTLAVLSLSTLLPAIHAPFHHRVGLEAVNG